MKKCFGIMIAVSFFCCSCTATKPEIKSEKSENKSCFEKKRVEKFPLWDGESPLWSMRGSGVRDMQEPVCILIYERAPGTKDWWYPTKVFSDTKTIENIVDRIMYPENPTKYAFYTDRYILILSMGRSLGSVSTTLIPFYTLEKKELVIIPSGRDSKLYEIINKAPEKKIFRDIDDIDMSQILPRMPRPDLPSIDPNKPAIPSNMGF